MATISSSLRYSSQAEEKNNYHKKTHQSIAAMNVLFKLAEFSLHTTQPISFTTNSGYLITKLPSLGFNMRLKTLVEPEVGMHSVSVSDLDGTLLNSQHEITPHTKQVIRRLHDAGIKFVFVTGRHHIDVGRLADELDISMY